MDEIQENTMGAIQEQTLFYILTTSNLHLPHPVYTYICVYTHTHISIHVGAHVCVFVYIERERKKLR